MKIGDKVRMVSDHIRSAVPPGAEGVIVDTGDIHDWVVRFQGRGRWAVNTDWLELVKPDTDKIEAALATTKKELGLCGEFDRAVDEAKALHLWATHPKEALELVAGRHNRLDVFDHFKKVYNRPEYTHAEAPNQGDYVRLTMKDGTTAEGKVVRSIQNGDYENYVRLDDGIRRWIPLTQEKFDWFKTSLYGPNNVIVKVEHIEKPVEIPEIGRWIKATTADGKEHVFEVTENYYATDRVYLWDGKVSPLGNGLRPRINLTKSAASPYTGNVITKWEYTDRPKVWKVGDVVPAGTEVGKRWLGRDGDSVALCESTWNGTKHFTTDRTIEWLEN